MAQRDSLHGAMPEFTVPSYLLLRKWTDAASNADNPESLVRGLCGAVIGAGIFDSVCVNVILQEKALRGFMSHGREFDFETISGMPEDSSCWALHEKKAIPRPIVLAQPIPCKCEKLRTRNEIGSMMSLPLVIEGRRIGSLSVMSPQSNCFNSDMASLLERLGAAFGQIIRNVAQGESAGGSKEYEKTLKLMLSTACDGTWEWEPESERLSIDQRAAWMFGKIKAKSVPCELSWKDIIPECEYDLFRGAIRHHMEGETKFFDYRFTVENLDRSSFILIRGVSQKSKDTTHTLVGSFKDITEKKENEQRLIYERRQFEKAISEKNNQLFVSGVNLKHEINLRFKTQEELLKSEKKFRTIAETSPIALIIIRFKDGNVLFSNPKAVSLFNANDAKSESFFKFVSNPSEMKKVYRKLLKFRHLDNYEISLNRQGSGSFSACVSMQLGYYDDVEAVFVGVMDVSEQKTTSGNLVKAISEFEEEIVARKKAEKALKESEKRYRMLSESIQVGIWQLDHKGLIKYINPKMAEMLETENAEDIIGKAFESYISEETIKTVDFDAFQQTGGLYSSYEAELLGEKGVRRNVIATGIGLFSEKGKFKYYIETFTDITERKNAEKKAQMHHQQLMQADKMASLGILVASVAHEINNPTNFITLNAPIIKDSWLSIRPITEEYFKQNGDFSIGGLHYSEMRDSLSQLIDGMIEGADRICDITNSLKDYARQEPDSKMNEKVELNLSVQKAIALLSNMIKNSTSHLEVTYSDEQLCCIGSRQKIEQVIVNLVQNACQALPRPEKAVRIRVGREDSVGMISVEDEGIGIPEENMPYLLDPFFTTKRDVGGTGLGLPIAAGIIKEHAGRIQIDSKEGNGTVVKVYFPLYEYDQGQL